MYPVKIVIHNVPNAHDLEEQIKRKAEKLSQFYQRIVNLHIVIEAPQKNMRHGNLFNVRIDVQVPGKTLAVNRKLNEDVQIAIRDAFHALIRQLETYARKRRGDVKTHESVNLDYIAKSSQE